MTATDINNRTLVRGLNHAERQRDDGNPGAAQVPQKRPADHDHYDEFLDQLVGQVLHGPINQLRAAIRRDDFNTVG